MMPPSSAAQGVAGPGAQGRRFGLRAHLVGLVLAVLLPAFAVGAGGIWLAIGSYGAAYEARLRDTARVMALAVDSEIEALRDGLAVLAVSDALQPGADPAMRDAALRRSAARLGTQLALLDTEGRWLAHSAAAVHEIPAPSPERLRSLLAAVETRQPQTSNLVLGAVARRPLASVLVPVMEGDRVAALLSARLEPERLRELLVAPGLGGDVVATLFDGGQRFIARSLDHDAFLGRDALPWFRQATEGRSEGVLSGPTLDGSVLTLGFARLRSAPAWLVSVGEPRAAYLRDLTKPLLALAAASLPLLLLGTAFALWLGQRLLRPLAELGAHARAVASGAATPGHVPAPHGRAGVTEFDALRSDIAAAEAALRRGEAQLRTIVETVPVGLVMAELPSGRIVGGNAYVEQLLRHPVLHSPDLHSYGEWVAFHADGRRVEGHEYPLARMVLAGEENPSIEVHYQRGDGTRAWTRITGRPVRDAAGRMTGGVVALVDMDAEHRARQALAESEARFRALFSAIDEGYCLCEIVPDGQGRPADYRFLEVNPLFEAMTGLKDAAGRRILELVPGIERHWVDTYARVALEGETLRFEQGSDAMGRVFDVFATPVEPRGRFALVFKDVTERRRVEAALRASEAGLRRAAAAARFATFDLDTTAGSFVVSGLFREMWGLPPGAPIGFDALLERVLPEDREALELHRREIARRGGAFEIEFRVVQADGSVRWLLSRGEAEPGTDGLPARAAGVNLDITERRAAEERQALLAREVDHRAKNALAVVQAALRLTPRDDAAAYARAIEGRVGALARAQTLLAEERWTGADLHALLRGELQAFVAAEGEAGPHADWDGPVVAVPVGAAQPLAIALHELATNAVKHGALSVPGGRVRVRWCLDPAAGRLRLRWTETGGPPLAGPPAHRGFGMRVLEGTVRGQLGGAVSLAWTPAGLACKMEVPLARGPAPPDAGATRKAAPA